MAAFNPIFSDPKSQLAMAIMGQPAQPPTAVDMANQSMFNEAEKIKQQQQQQQQEEAAKAAAEQAVIEQQKQQNLLDQARAAYKAAYEADAPLITDKTGLALINGILQNKTAWQDFNDKAYTANVEGRQNDYNALLQEREKAAQRGAYLREQADKLGYNLKNFGSDVTLDQALANLNLNNTRALDRELKEGLDAGSVYASKFNEYKKNGITDEYADRYAREEANKYLNDRTNKLVDTLVNQGFDERGALSRQGIQLLSRLLSENPEQVQLWLGTNASPMMEWGRQSEWDKAEQAFGHNMNILNRQAEIAADQAERNFRNQVALRSMFGGGGRSAGGGGRSGSGSGRSSGGGKGEEKEEKLSAKEQKILNQWENYVRTVRSYLDGENSEQNIEKTRELVSERQGIINKLISDGDIKYEVGEEMQVAQDALVRDWDNWAKGNKTRIDELDKQLSSAQRKRAAGR